MRKIFTFLCAALMSVGMFAATEVTITNSDFPKSGSFTKYGVTVSAGNIDGTSGNITGPGSFSTTLGNFTEIEVTASNSISGPGWAVINGKKTWKGNAASSVSFGGNIMGMGMGVTLKFTIAEPAPAIENSITINGTPQVGDNSISLTYYFDPANVPGICCNAPTLKVKCAADNQWDEKWLSLNNISSGTTTITLDELGSFQEGKSYDVCFAYNNGSWVDDVFQSFTPAASTPEPEPEPEQQEESLLTTLTFGGSETYGETTSGVVTVTATNVGSYNGTYGWLLDEGGSLSVTAKEGYTITKCVFHQNAKTPITDTEAPFEIHANDWGGIIEDPYEDMNGVTSIEVYGYATPEPEPEPATTYNVTFTDINSNVKVVENITLPHTFSCDYTNGNGELDLIIQEFYNEPGGHCATNGWPWGGNDNEVVVGHDGNNHFVTINAPFIGTSFMSGYYEGINDGNFFYTFHITIAASTAEPEPTPVTDPITPYEDPQDANVYYSTFYDSNFKYELPTGVEAYVADLSGANLLLTKIAEAGEVIPADNAVILKSSVTPVILTQSDAAAVTFTATNDLQGSDTQIATPANCYVLAGTDGVVGFYRYTADNLNAHKAYVVYAGSNQAPRRMPFIFDAATGNLTPTLSQGEGEKILRDGQLIIIKNGVKFNAMGQIVK